MGLGGGRFGNDLLGCITREPETRITAKLQIDAVIVQILGGMFHGP